MAEQLFSVGLGYEVQDDATGIIQTQYFPVDGLPGDAGLNAEQLALSDNAPIGSKSVDTLTGFEYRKKTLGAGTTTWTKIADADDIAASGGTESWRDPAIVKEDTLYANLAAAEVALNTGSLDGVVVNAGDRILLTNTTGSNKNVYIVTGTPGAGATLVEDSNLATHNDALIIDDGTFSGIEYHYNSVSDTWVNSGQNGLDEDGFQNSFMGKSGTGSELPTYTSTNIVANNDNLEVAIGKLDTAVDTNATDISTLQTSATNLQTEIDAIESAIGSSIDANGDYVAHAGTNYIDGNGDITEDITDLDAQVKVNADAIAGITNDDSFQNSFIGKGALGAETPTYTSNTVVTPNTDLEAAIGELDARLDLTNHYEDVTGVVAVTTIDTVLVDNVKAVRWLVHVQQGTKVKTFEVDATHDGTAGSDATDSDFTKYARLKMNGNIGGLKVKVVVAGTAGAQTMGLTVEANAAVVVSTSRLSVI